MTTETYNNSPALVYNGEVIHAKSEMLSLTDMWKAAGADEAKRPANWARKEGSDFIAHMEAVLNVPVGHIIRGERGRNGNTWGHWQIALAYAKYLNPAFHEWCNSVVRERMEERSLSTANLPADVLEVIERTNGIARMLAHKVTGIEQTVALLATMVKPPQPVLVRQGKTAGQIWKAFGLAPLKGAAVWLGNRLAAFDCRLPDNACGEMGLTKARLFDPDKAEYWYVQGGGRSACTAYVAERKGQTRLRLIGGYDNVLAAAAQEMGA